ncbi:MAG: hypothetical protein MI976_12245 [Pseudomonadales bacterium]|nr:hypothetical protein [Pseudomonadales bacterium]
MSLTSNGLFHPKNRFGFHTDLLSGLCPDYQDRAKAECYIPTRAEVFQLKMTEIKPILIHWFKYSPEPLHPTAEQKQAVIELLKKRFDAQKCATDIAELESIRI